MSIFTYHFKWVKFDNGPCCDLTDSSHMHHAHMTISSSDDAFDHIYLPVAVGAFIMNVDNISDKFFSDIDDLDFQCWSQGAVR